jgi:hypothetical protein
VHTKKKGKKISLRALTETLSQRANGKAEACCAFTKKNAYKRKNVHTKMFSLRVLMAKQGRAAQRSTGPQLPLFIFFFLPPFVFFFLRAARGSTGP